MRTPFYPTMNDNKILDYLLEVVLEQTGTIKVDHNGCMYEVYLIEDPSRVESVFVCHLLHKPDQCKYSRAKHIGITGDLTDIKKFILAYDPYTNEEEYTSKRDRRAKKLSRKANPEVIPVDDWRT